jgi:hypothetical protein
VQTEAYLLELARYIVLNPVRVRMVRCARDWPWSSYRETSGQRSAPKWLKTDWILLAFGQKISLATRAYRLFVSQGKNSSSPWHELKNQIYLGDESFVERLHNQLEADRDLSELPKVQRRSVPKALRDYERSASARNEAIRMAYASGGYTMKEIGDYFGLHYSRISRLLKTNKAKGKT